MNYYFRLRNVVAILPAIALFACNPPRESNFPDAKPPIAKVQPFEIVAKHGHKRIDNYFWLKNREDSSVIHYLQAENKYLDTMLAHTKPLQEKLFAELRGRIKDKDESVPYKLDDYYYYTRFEEGSESGELSDRTDHGNRSRIVQGCYCSSSFCGCDDHQVQYWEPAKWVAKLRALKTDNNKVFLHTNMDAGHGGASGRFKALKEYALQSAFMMDLVGIKE